MVLTLVGAVLVVLTSAGTAMAGPREPSTGGPERSRPATIPMADFRPSVRFTAPHSSVASEPTTATLDVPGPGGAFAVPYIQASSDLDYSLELNGPAGRTIVDVVLDQGRPGQQTQRLTGPSWTGTFHGLAYGEHTLDARLYAPEAAFLAPLALAQPPVATSHLGHIARGDVIVAIGDSITEGISGGPFPPGTVDRLGYFPDWVAARNALGSSDPGLVSGDGRQYPQAGASLHPASRPGFVVPLAGLLERGQGHPVLVINEGWSGITADGFVKVAQSQHFHDLVAATHPNGWLINLGVNDALVQRPAAEYQARLATLVGILNRMGARSADIHLACPSYRNDPAHKDLEASYLPVVDGLRSQLGLGAGPDFFAHYRDHASDLADWVHPNAAGYAAMAQLWSDALAGRGSKCAG